MNKDIKVHQDNSDKSSLVAGSLPVDIKVGSFLSFFKRQRMKKRGDDFVNSRKSQLLRESSLSPCPRFKLNHKRKKRNNTVNLNQAVFLTPLKKTTFQNYMEVS